MKFGISSTICRVLKWHTKRRESMAAAAAAEGFPVHPQRLTAARCNIQNVLATRLTLTGVLQAQGSEVRGQRQRPSDRVYSVVSARTASMFTRSILFPPQQHIQLARQQRRHKKTCEVEACRRCLSDSSAPPHSLIPVFRQMWQRWNTWAAGM